MLPLLYIFQNVNNNLYLHHSIHFQVAYNRLCPKNMLKTYSEARNKYNVC